ncbi:MAG TPA: murein L,D-transpeptidase catalytic domain family protein [Chitinophagales bacterium]
MFHLLVSLFLLLHPANNVPDELRIKQHAEELRTIAETDSFNTDFAILIDFSITSQYYRFFVVDLHNDSVLIRGLCGHGGGHKPYDENVEFSNVSGSELSSAGKYLIGSEFYGMFGSSYKLYGIDTTNSNALNRGLVLHAYPTVHDEEWNHPTTLSNGCPMVSQHIFEQTATLIDQSDLPILMWIYK